MGYWNYEDYLGIGPGAHSRIGFNQNDSVKIAAFFDIYKPENWLNSLNHNDEFDHKDIFNFQKNKPGFIQNIEILENQKILEEMILMGLRKKEGILLDFFQKRFGADKKFFDLIDKDIIFHFSRNEFLEINENSLFLTTKGLKVSDFIIKKICDNLL